MKILQVINLGYPVGGAEKSACLIRDELRRRGHDVKILSSNTIGGGVKFSDYEFKSISQFSWLKLFHHLFYFRSYFKMRQIIKGFRPDVIHFHTIASSSPSVFFAIGRTPAIMTVHGPEEFIKELLPWFLPPSDYKGDLFILSNLTMLGVLHYWYYCYIQKPIYRVGLSRVKVFIAPSQYLAKIIQSDVPIVKIRQLYNGIDLPTAQPLPENFNILYAGRLEEVKGVDYLIKAFTGVVSRVPSARLRIAGDGSHKETLERLVFELNLGDYVTFCGKLGEKKLLEEYKNSIALVIPSVWPENLPTVCIEALAVGRVVIGTDVGGIPELIVDKETGYLVSSKNVQELTEAIVKLFDNRQMLVSMSKAAQMSAARFDIRNFVDKIESLYNKITL